MSPSRHLGTIRDFLIALSFANLCFLNVWRELIFADEANSYWMPSFTWASYLAVILNVLLLTILLYLVFGYLIRSQRRWQSVLGQLLILATVLLPLNYLRVVLGIDADTIMWLQDHQWLSSTALVAFGVLALYLVFYRLRLLTHIIEIVCLVLVPFALLNLGQASWSAIKLASAAPPVPIIQQPIERPKQRLLWLLMDELDLRLAFYERPPGIELPEFDRLRSQSFFARNPISHSRDTREAIPSFLLQKVVRKARPVGSAELELKFMDFEKLDDTKFSNIPNFFEGAAALGARIGIIGFYHPYCRLFAKEASYCRNFSLLTYSPYATHNIWTEAWSQITGSTPLYRRINSVKRYKESRKEILRIAGNSGFDLIYMHAGVPHRPPIWDPKQERFVLFNVSKSGYFDNLILADRLLCEIRNAMESAGQWESTAVLLTSDHEWRQPYHHDGRRETKVPYLLKLPGQKTTYEFKPAFAPMQVTKDLLLEILVQNLRSPLDVANWLERRVSSAPECSPSAPTGQICINQ